MLLKVHVTPNSKEPRVTKLNEEELEVKIDERAEEGKANKRLIKVLSEYYRVPKSKISIIRGSRSRDKIVSIEY